MRALALILIWLVLAVPGIAQETPGIYLDHRSFHAGRPDVSLDSVTFDWYFSEEDGYARGTIRGSARQVIEPLVVCFPGACFLLDAGRLGDARLHPRRQFVGPQPRRERLVARVRGDEVAIHRLEQPHVGLPGAGAQHDPRLPTQPILDPRGDGRHGRGK